MNQTSKKVLTVEDDAPQRNALRDTFMKEGFTVLEAKDGEEGLQIALREHPDVIVLDIMMPKMNGIEMAKRLREDAWGKTAKILMLTNADDLAHVNSAMSQTVHHYLVKADTSIENIVESVQGMLRESIKN